MELRNGRNKYGAEWIFHLKCKPIILKKIAIMDKIDNLFAKPITPETFRFDQVVAEVFPDMIKRSVPGYNTIIEGIGKIAHKYIQKNSLVYDLGCSLGAATLSIREQVIDRSYQIVGLDNSEAMVNRCLQHLQVYRSNIPTEIVLADILEFKYQPCSFAVLNFTLQFLELKERTRLLEKIYQSLHPGGALILSEKILFDNELTNQTMVDLHHQFKKNNGYSDLEIAQKRAALERFLIPETQQVHLERLNQVGFSRANIWFQHYNFSSFLAVK